MDRWPCRRTAEGVSRFCGRTLRENHDKTRPFILEVIDNRTPTRALVAEEALYCGRCTSRPDPVDLPEVDP